MVPYDADLVDVEVTRSHDRSRGLLRHADFVKRL